MIGRLIGQCVDVEDGVATIMVNDVGYEIATSQEPLVGPSVALFIHTHVTDDSIALYGFESTERRKRFRSLIAISGIGPKSALKMCAADDAEFARAIKSSDRKFFTAFEGIGPKTADRIIESLR